jgi:peptidoglycan/xylan/chitin deacetylase (PgdA/CDA1 family)
VARSLEILQSITGTRVLGYRAPSWSISDNTLWALPILKDLGLAYDSSIFPVKTPLFGMSSAARVLHEVSVNGGHTLYEFPPATLQPVAQMIRARRRRTGTPAGLQNLPAARARVTSRSQGRAGASPPGEALGS